MGRDGRAPQRELVHDALSGASMALTAAELRDRLAQQRQPIGLATVYRALDVLVRERRVTRLPASSREQRYLACSPEHHHHVVCTDCGRVAEVAMCPAPDVQRQAELASGFALTSHVLDFYGRCPDCLV